MHVRSSRAPITLGILLSAVLVGSCVDKEALTDPSNPGTQLQSYLTGAFGNFGAGADAVDRLVQTVLGNPQPGVTYNPTPSGGDGSVDVDTNGDGTNEMTLTGSVTYNDPSVGILSGAVIAVTSITSPGIASGSGAVSVFPTGPTTATVFAFSSGPPTSAVLGTDGTVVEIYDVDLSGSFANVQPSGGQSAVTIIGFIHVRIILGDTTIDADIFFEDDGSGGLRIHVVDIGNGIDFTIP